VNLETGYALQINTLQFGLGVNAKQIQAIRDHFLDMQLTQTITRQAGTQTRYEGVENVAALFMENGESGFGIELQRFFQAFEELAARPEDDAVRTNVVTRAQTWITGMKSRYSMIEDKRAEANKSVGSISVEVNTLAAQIARLNKEIACEYPKGSDNNSRNQRQALVDQLAGLVGIQCYEDSLGRMTITVENGIPIVSGDRAFVMHTSGVDAEGMYTVEIEVGNPYEAPPGSGIWFPGEKIDVTKDIKSGKMGGCLDLRDNILPEYMHNLDQLAAGVVAEVNKLHYTGAGLGPGTDMIYFFVNNTDYANGAQLEINAATGLPIDNGLSVAIDINHNYGGMVNNLNVNKIIEDNPRYVASASVNGEPGNNEIARKLAALQTTDNTVLVPVFDSAGLLISTISKGPYSKFISSVANTVGNQALKLKASSNTDENIRVALEIQRDRLSAVDMDEEATNLMTFQRSYQACSRFINVINQLTDQLINNFGR
jgi:flagellar hook-associated protein 1 FlgK